MPQKRSNVTGEAPAKTAGKPRLIQSIGVGFGLLRCLERSAAPMSLTELAAAAGMPTSQAHLYMVSFVHEQVVQQDPATLRYDLGRYALQLGVTALRRLDVVELAGETLQALLGRIGESVYLAIWTALGPVIVRKLDGSSLRPMAVQVGTILPMLTTATGRVCLTYLAPEATVAAVRQQSPGGTRHDLAAIRAQVREAGLARSDGQLKVGLTALSVPVFDHAGQLAAALTVLGSSGVLDMAEGGAPAHALLRAGGDLSSRLGYAAASHSRSYATQAG